jgi:hypothetical protein
MMLQSTRKLKRFRMYVSDQEVGRIERLYIDTTRWDVRYLLLLKSNWISSRRLLVSTPSMKNATFVKNRIHLESRDQLEKEMQVEVSIVKSKPDDLIQVKTKLPVFRSRGTYSSLLDADKLTGYHLRAENGTGGFLTDLAVDLIRWSFRYIIIKKSKLPFWRKTLIPPLWIDSVNTSARQININLPKRAITKAPELSTVAGITPSFERRLVYHYGSDEFKL